MNDFTKDELETIYLWISDIPDIKGWPENCDRTTYYRNLAHKIQAMIDNYCAHDAPYTKLGITVCLDCKQVIKNPDGIKIDE